MDTWNPYMTVTAFVFAVYVLIAVFGSRDAGRETADSIWSRLRHRHMKSRRESDRRDTHRWFS